MLTRNREDATMASKLWKVKEKELLKVCIYRKNNIIYVYTL